MVYITSYQRVLEELEPLNFGKFTFHGYGGCWWLLVDMTFLLWELITTVANPENHSVG